MAIVSRLTRLFAADAHAVLDHLEEPEALLRQAIREMEAALAAQAQTLRQLHSDRDQQQRRVAEIRTALARVGEELDLSFDANHEALIRKSLRRRLEGERLIKMLEQRLATLSDKIEQISPALEQQRERLEAMRQKAALFEIETVSCSAGESAGWSADDICISETDIDLALLRERQARSAS